MKYFLTGATGFIGGALCRQLLADDHQVVALVRDQETARDLAALGVELCRGDVRDEASMRPGMAGVDGVFHVAAWYRVGVRDTSEAESINVHGTRKVMELVRELEIPRVVYTSSVAIYSDTEGRLVKETERPWAPPASAYEDTKRRAHVEVERMVATGLPAVTVMPGMAYGPGDRGPVADSMVQWLRGKLPMLPRDTAYCWTHVEDVARGHILAMERGKVGESYFLTGPRHTLIEVFELAARIVGRDAPGVHVPPGLLRGLARVLTPVSRHVPLPNQYHPETFRSVAGVTATGDNHKAREQLGFDPRSLADGYPEYVQWQMDEMRITPSRA